MKYKVSCQTFMERQIKTAQVQLENCEGHHTGLVQIRDYVLTHEPPKPLRYTSLQSFNEGFGTFIKHKNEVLSKILQNIERDIDLSTLTYIKEMHYMYDLFKGDMKKQMEVARFMYSYLVLNGCKSTTNIIREHKILCHFKNLEKDLDEFWNPEKTRVKVYESWKSRLENINNLLSHSEENLDTAKGVLQSLQEEYGCHGIK